ncbi:MAG: hypothetical protein PHQ98_01430 [Candidatus ainarchaeum sp.]|nr:hypothetical protein [Candidatus ainarchaeum sp.]
MQKILFDQKGQNTIEYLLLISALLVLGVTFAVLLTDQNLDLMKLFNASNNSKNDALVILDNAVDYDENGYFYLSNNTNETLILTKISTFDFNWSLKPSEKVTVKANGLNCGCKQIEKRNCDLEVIYTKSNGLEFVQTINFVANCVEELNVANYIDNNFSNLSNFDSNSPLIEIISTEIVNLNDLKITFVTFDNNDIAKFYSRINYEGYEEIAPEIVDVDENKYSFTFVSIPNGINKYFIKVQDYASNYSIDSNYFEKE